MAEHCLLLGGFGLPESMGRPRPGWHTEMPPKPKSQWTREASIIDLTVNTANAIAQVMKGTEERICLNLLLRWLILV